MRQKYKAEMRREKDCENKGQKKRKKKKKGGGGRGRTKFLLRNKTFPV